MLVADFKGFDVPYSAEGNYYYAAGRFNNGNGSGSKRFKKRLLVQTFTRNVAFDLMTYQDEKWKVIEHRVNKFGSELGVMRVERTSGWKALTD